MTIKDLYNALEKAIDSGEATIDTELAMAEYTSDGWGTVDLVYMLDGMLILEETY